MDSFARASDADDAAAREDRRAEAGTSAPRRSSGQATTTLSPRIARPRLGMDAHGSEGRAPGATSGFRVRTRRAGPAARGRDGAAMRSAVFGGKDKGRLDKDDRTPADQGARDFSGKGRPSVGRAYGLTRSSTRENIIGARGAFEQEVPRAPGMRPIGMSVSTALKSPHARENVRRVARASRPDSGTGISCTESARAFSMGGVREIRTHDQHYPNRFHSPIYLMIKPNKIVTVPVGR